MARYSVFFCPKNDNNTYRMNAVHIITPYLLRSIWTLSFHLQPGLPSGFIPLRYSTCQKEKQIWHHISMSCRVPTYRSAHWQQVHLFTYLAVQLRWKQKKKQQWFYVIVLDYAEERLEVIMECTTYLRYRSDTQRCWVYIRVGIHNSTTARTIN
jgi:hypothetical protein